MKRRDFLSTSAAMAAAGVFPSPGNARESSTHPLRFAARLGMFKRLAGESLHEQIAFAASQGVAAFEDGRLLQRPFDEIARASQQLAEFDMTWGAAPVWEEYGRPFFHAAQIEKFASALHATLALAQQIPTFRFGVIVPGRFLACVGNGTEVRDYVRTIRTAAREAEQLGFTFLFHPVGELGGSRPMWLRSVENAVKHCEAIDRPAFKVLYDVYEQATYGRDVADDLRRYRQHIGYIHIGDAPGNKEPGTGTVRFDELFAQLREQQFDGIIGLDHGHSRPGLAGEIAVLEGYRRLLA